MSNLKQIGLGLMMYVQDYDQTYPALSAGYSVNGVAQYWYDLLQPYTKSYQVWVCPTAGPVYGTAGRKYSYGLNTNGTISITSTNTGDGFGKDLSGAGTSHGGGGGPVKESEIKNPSGVIFAGDTASNGLGTTTVYVGILLGWSQDSFIPVLHGGQVGPFTGGQKPVDTSMGGGNYLFADGHVKFMQAQKLSPKATRAPYFNIH